MQHLKWLHDAASDVGGFDALRMCAAGFLYLLEHPSTRIAAMLRLAEFEGQGGSQYSTPEKCVDYITKIYSSQAPPEIEDRMVVDLIREYGKQLEKKPAARKAQGGG